MGFEYIFVYSVVLILVVATITIWVMSYTPPHETTPEDEQEAVEDYNPPWTRATKKEDRRVAIDNATNVSQLRDMERFWIRRGLQKGGLLHTYILARINELGGKMTKYERDLLRNASERHSYGASLPRIKGRMRV